MEQNTNNKKDKIKIEKFPFLITLLQRIFSSCQRENIEIFHWNDANEKIKLLFITRFTLFARFSCHWLPSIFAIEKIPVWKKFSSDEKVKETVGEYLQISMNWRFPYILFQELFKCSTNVLARIVKILFSLFSIILSSNTFLIIF